MGLVKCVAYGYGCQSRRTPGCQIVFHRFPTGNPQRRQWEIATKIKNFSARTDDVLCANHFTRDSYLPGGVKKLKPEAVPVIFEFPSSSHHSNYVKPRPLPKKRPPPTETCSEIVAKKEKQVPIAPPKKSPI